MNDENNNSDSEDNLFGDSLGLFDDFPGLPKSDETPDSKKERPAPDKPSKTPVQKKSPPQKPVVKKPAQQKSSQNTSGKGSDLFDDLKVPGEADKTPVTKKSPVKPTKPPAQKQPPPQKPLKKKASPSAPPKQSKPPVKKDTPAPEKKSPVMETAKKAPQKVPQKKEQEIIPEKKSPVKETAPPAASSDSKPVPAAGKSPKEAPEKVKKPVKQKKEKIVPADKPKKRSNPIIFTLSIIVLVILSMFIGSIIDFNSILNFIKMDKSPDSVSEPVPDVNMNKQKAPVPKKIKTPPPKEEILEAKTEPVIEPTVEPKVEKPEPQVPDTSKEKEEVQVKAEPAPPEKPGEISGLFKKKVLSFPYSVYFGSYSGIANVKKASSDYEEMGITCYWIKLDLGEKGTWYRLFAGYFKTRKEADDFIKASKLQGAESKITKYTNLIGTFTSKEDLEKYKTILEEKGYSTYIINDADDTYQLYTGAFYQKDRAEEQHSSLALDGIESELVER